MKIVQAQYTASEGWVPLLKADPSVSVIFIFAGTASLRNQIGIQPLRVLYPKALFFGCSTAGEIAGEKVNDESMVATIVSFEHSSVSVAHARTGRMEESAEIGTRLGQGLPKKGLAHVFLLSNGLVVDTELLLRGLVAELPAGVAVTGGLAGDGIRFDNALILDKNGLPSPSTVAALGLYGDRLKVGYGSQGGWLPFGPTATVTRAQKNVVYELDGKPALKFYKKCLGVEVVSLPMHGILFPLCMQKIKEGPGVIRTVIAVDESAQSITTAGEFQAGSLLGVMKASADELKEGAASAAALSGRTVPGNTSPELALLVSCVGRKFILGPGITEELTNVRKVLGTTVLAGFYSYGEISPCSVSSPCELHNLTMTITTLLEK